MAGVEIIFNGGKSLLLSEVDPSRLQDTFRLAVEDGFAFEIDTGDRLLIVNPANVNYIRLPKAEA